MLLKFAAAMGGATASAFKQVRLEGDTANALRLDFKSKRQQRPPSSPKRRESPSPTNCMLRAALPRGLVRRMYGVGSAISAYWPFSVVSFWPYCSFVIVVLSIVDAYFCFLSFRLCVFVLLLLSLFFSLLCPCLHCHSYFCSPVPAFSSLFSVDSLSVHAFDGLMEGQLEKQETTGKQGQFYSSFFSFVSVVVSAVVSVPVGLTMPS